MRSTTAKGGLQSIPTRRTPWPAAALLIALAAIVFSPSSPSTAPGDLTADMVAGQLNFALNMPNFTDALGLLFPAALAIDNSATPPHLYSADQNNNRVLGWLNAQAFANGAPADLVIGEPDFFTVVPAVASNHRPCPAASATNLCFPRGVAVDSHGNLYVADTSNNRVLEYNTTPRLPAERQRTVFLAKAATSPAPIATAISSRPIPYADRSESRSTRRTIST